jgi:hypothetical protein
MAAHDHINHTTKILMAYSYRSVFNLLVAAALAYMACSIFFAKASFANIAVYDEQAITAFNTLNKTNINNSPLVLSGSTTRRMFFFKVYRISHFMKATEGLPTQRNALVSHILNGRVPQRVELEFLRDVTPKQVEKALIDGIERNNENTDLTHIKKEITRLSYGFDDEIKKNSLLRLERHGSSSLSVFFNNEFIVKTNNAELIHALWSIWFGHDPIVETDALISQLLSQ